MQLIKSFHQTTLVLYDDSELEELRAANAVLTQRVETLLDLVAMTQSQVGRLGRSHLKSFFAGLHLAVC